PRSGCCARRAGCVLPPAVRRKQGGVMAEGSTAIPRRPDVAPDSAGAVLASLAFPVVMVAPDNTVAYVNAAAEQFFGAGCAVLVGRPLARLIAGDSPLISLIEQVRSDGVSISEY